VGLSRGRKKENGTTHRVALLAAAVSVLVTERRSGAIEDAILECAVSVTGATGGRLTRHDGGVAAERGALTPGSRLLSRDLTAGGGFFGRLDLWGDALVDDDREALSVIADLGAQLIKSGESAQVALEDDSRRRRIGEAAADIAGAGGRADALAALLAHARSLLGAPLAAILIIGADNTFQSAVEDGVVGPQGEVDIWSLLPQAAGTAVSGGSAYFGEVTTFADSGVYAVAPLAHGEAKYGALGLTGFADHDAVDRLFVSEFAERASAAIWIASLEEEVRELSTVDPVTRLYDGRYFRQRLDQEINRAIREDAPLSVLVLGLDGSDDLRAQGRDAAADDVLLDLAVQVGQARRAMDVVCRLAGDEIAMILPGSAGLDSVLVAERVRAAARAGVVSLDLGAVSVGVATLADAGPGREEMISAGRAALGFARSYGGDRVFLYDRDVATLVQAEQHDKVAGDDAFVATVYALAAAVDARDPSTCEHSQGVARICASLARELGLASPHVEQVRTAGLLHDVGKIGVSDRVLCKTGPLNEEEWEEMRQHPVVAHRILAGTRLDDIRPWILHHHEQVDGGGYPDGLSGDAIPLESRIIAVAEAFDSMVQGRPWRPAVGAEAALQEIARCSGSKFDTAVVSALQALAVRGEPGLLPQPGNQ
jgi:diguanylate cyclase (GGDEF)-like protein/putative nucleotidyltransferase with HDIG domain